MATKQRYSARKMLSVSTSQLVEKLTGEFTVVFDDNSELVMKAQEVVFSSFVWDIHRQLPWLPVVPELTINSIQKGNLLNAGAHIRLFERVFWYVIDQAELQGIVFDVDRIDALNEFIYRQSNALYNYACTNLEADVISTDLEDYYELLIYPAIKEAVDALEPNEASIAETYRKVTEVIMKDPAVSDYALVVAARSSMVKLNQLLQCIVCRGFVTDIDSMIFPEPSTGNFASGYEDYYSLLVDTRTAAKSLYFSARLLRQAEYNSRKLQILCQSVQTVHPGDCGSEHYLTYVLKANTYHPDGTLDQKGDIERFAGKYFLDEETQRLRELKPDDTKYLGKALKFRSPLGGCAHPDPHGVCTMCFGAMAKVIPEHTNIGQMLAAALMQILSQSILAVKHIDSSSSSAPAVLTPHQKEYLELDSTGKGYHFHKKHAGRKIVMYVAESEMSRIASLQSVTDFQAVVPSHFSELNQVLLDVTDPNSFDGEMGILLPLSSEKREAFFTPEALAYIKQLQWTKNDKNQVVLDFSDWDNKKPFAALPQRHFNNADHAKDIAELIQGRSGAKSDKDKRRQDGSVMGYFEDLYRMVNSRLDVPAVIIEHIVYGASIRDSARSDYRLPRAGTSREMGLSAETVPYRSMGAAMAYEHHVRALFQTTQGFDRSKTASHVMDVFVTPEEAVNDAARRGLR